MPKSEIGAETVSVSQPREVQDVNIELYYQLVFTPTKGHFTMNSESQIYWGEIFSPRLVYMDDSCGVDKGKVADSRQLVVGCPTLDSDDKTIENIIRQTEYEIDQFLVGYLEKASLVTLHLAIHSETTTENIARCFVSGINANPACLPDDEKLTHYKVLQNAQWNGFSIQIDFFQTFDTFPFLLRERTLNDLPISDYLLVDSEDEEGGIIEEGTGQLVSVMEGDLIENHSDNQFGLDMCPITEIDLLGTSCVKKEDGYGIWSWKQTSSVVHAVLDNVSTNSGKITLVLLGSAGVTALIPGGQPIAVALLAGAGVAEFISTTTAILDVFFYFVDYYEAKADREYDLALKSLNKGFEEAAWFAFSIIGGKFTKKNIKAFLSKQKKFFNTEEINTLNENLQVISRHKKSIEKQLEKLEELLKRTGYKKKIAEYNSDYKNLLDQYKSLSEEESVRSIYKLLLEIEKKFHINNIGEMAGGIFGLSVDWIKGKVDKSGISEKKQSEYVQ